MHARGIPARVDARHGRIPFESGQLRHCAGGELLVQVGRERTRFDLELPLLPTEDPLQVSIGAAVDANAHELAPVVDHRRFAGPLREPQHARQTRTFAVVHEVGRHVHGEGPPPPQGVSLGDGQGRQLLPQLVLPSSKRQQRLHRIRPVDLVLLRRELAPHQTHLPLDAVAAEAKDPGSAEILDAAEELHHPPSGSRV
jgi:hypothetical protein